VGFVPAADGYRLAFGFAGGSVLVDPTTDPAARRAGLLAAAIGFFLAALVDAPVELEATHADVAALVASLAAAGDDEYGTAAREAVDAIDDGLPADAVALRLQRLLPPGTDPLGILRGRLAAVS
jgi:hypothetical protein